MPTGTILAYSIPDGAEVYIDGAMISTRTGAARTPAIIPEVPAGTRNITFILKGYIDETKRVEVPQGGYITVYVALHNITKPSI
jgi:hypothetical protein